MAGLCSDAQAFFGKPAGILARQIEIALLKARLSQKANPFMRDQAR